MNQHTITAAPAELAALVEILQRAPMTLGEKLMIDQLTDRWYRQLATPAIMSEHTGTPAGPPSPPNAPEPALVNGSTP